MRYYILSIVGAAFLGACATNEASMNASNDAASLTAEEQAAADGDDVVCKSVVEKHAGRTRTKRLCKPSHEWEEMQEAAEEQQVAENEDNDDRVICKRTVVTGSRFTKRICKTWAEWRAIQQESSDWLSDSQRRHRSVDHRPGG